MRLAAWAAAPIVTHEGTTYEETFRDCERCVGGCNERRDEARQSSHRCPIVPRAKRNWCAPMSFRYMGDSSPEDPERPERSDEGCPGGWYRTAWALSVFRYLRPVAEGVYSPNLLLDQSNDPLVIEAVTYFEHQQMRWRAWSSEMINRQYNARANR